MYHCISTCLYFIKVAARILSKLSGKIVLVNYCELLFFLNIADAPPLVLLGLCINDNNDNIRSVNIFCHHLLQQIKPCTIESFKAVSVVKCLTIAVMSIDLHLNIQKKQQ